MTQIIDRLDIIFLKNHFNLLKSPIIKNYILIDKKPETTDTGIYIHFQYNEPGIIYGSTTRNIYIKLPETIIVRDKDGFDQTDGTLLNELYGTLGILNEYYTKNVDNITQNTLIYTRKPINTNPDIVGGKRKSIKRTRNKKANTSSKKRKYKKTIRNKRR